MIIITKQIANAMEAMGITEEDVLCLPNMDGTPMKRLSKKDIQSIKDVSEVFNRYRDVKNTLTVVPINEDYLIETADEIRISCADRNAEISVVVYLSERLSDELARKRTSVIFTILYHTVNYLEKTGLDKARQLLLNCSDMFSELNDDLNKYFKCKEENDTQSTDIDK